MRKNQSCSPTSIGKEMLLSMTENNRCNCSNTTTTRVVDQQALGRERQKMEVTEGTVRNRMDSNKINDTVNIGCKQRTQVFMCTIIVKVYNSSMIKCLQ